MKSEKIGDCGCRLERHSAGLVMVDCPLHKAAPELLEALEALLKAAAKLAEATGEDGAPIWGFIEDANDAVLKARGE